MQPNPFDLARANLTLLHRQPATAVPLPRRHKPSLGAGRGSPSGGSQKAINVTRQEGRALLGGHPQRRVDPCSTTPTYVRSTTTTTRSSTSDPSGRANRSSGYGVKAARMCTDTVNDRQYWALTGPDGLLKLFTRTVLETA
jgi:hypothetical protein